MAHEFGHIGLEYTIKNAIDSHYLTPQHLSKVDWEGRRQLGLYPQALGSIACWLTYREVMQDLVNCGPPVMAIFQDDARFHPVLPKVLCALEMEAHQFDVVVLHRRNPSRQFIPRINLRGGHVLGRVKYHDSGAEGYVITRRAASHFLQSTSMMIREIDQAIPRFWESGLNVYYVNPPVVFHGETNDSQIEMDRERSRKQRNRNENSTLVLCRRLCHWPLQSIRKRIAFRNLLKGNIGVTRRCAP